jgi:hypothetical protein
MWNQGTGAKVMQRLARNSEELERFLHSAAQLDSS